MSVLMNYIYIFYIIYIFIIWLQLGFSPVAVVQQVHNRQVTHITRSNNTIQSNTINNYNKKQQRNKNNKNNKKLNMLFNNPKVMDA
jgi:hypothetical protein